MLQYIINTSIIWLICLVVYELLLRKESFHQYNRAFLLVSIAAGLLLPMTNLSSFVPADNKVLHQPVQHVYELKRAVLITEDPIPGTAPAASEATASSPINVETIIWAVYLVGLGTGIILIAREAIRLVKMYSKGLRSSEAGCIIVETGKDHCAFSFFNIIFISSKKNYTATHWALIITHEKEHGRQLHSLDNLLLIVLRIVFWFHPLPHIYFRKLRLVHEYQADAVATINNAEYGTFLLEQSLLQGAPVLTHSINYSPIKNRIAMLTATRSSRRRLFKYTSVVPLAFLLIIFCTQTSFSGKGSSSGNKIMFKGNEIAFGTYKVYPFEYAEVLQKQKDAFQYAPLPDSVPMKNWATGEISMMAVPVDTVPVALNGNPIFGDEAKYKFVQTNVGNITPAFNGTEKDPEHYLFSQIKKDVSKLENGFYSLRIDNVVVDENGEIAYYEYKGITTDTKTKEVPDDVKNTVDRKLIELLDGAIKFSPVKIKDGKPVNVRLQLSSYEIQVQNHIAKLVERRGC